ncbi:hypothetical protein Pint_14518 [Pistacia integerrima]|uniref:Uncharacterized protein n=1 Tax=Pistacia integerrima TaxID=434235 RepID=A0ACC0Y836_9ROSI|nr:hypothetical protein Pint_14518 [Pistacia integerrima]
MASTICEVVWLVKLSSELGFPILTFAPLYCDNQSANHIAYNPMFHEHTKHINIDTLSSLKHCIFLEFLNIRFFTSC